MKKVVIIILLLAPFLLYAQQKYNPKNVKSSTKVVVNKIKSVNVLMSSAIYRSAMRPKQYDNFEKLKEVASKEEMIELTNHPNGVVRCYAFWALSDNKSIDLFPVILNHIRDEKYVNTQFGCVGDRRMVGDFFINIAKLDSIQRAKLDSILIYSDSKLEAKSDAIYEAKPTESLYPRIRKIYTKDNNQSALVTLAKYRILEDVPLILNNKDEKEEYDKYYYTYEAIQEFPHADFLPFLEKKLYETLDSAYFSNEWSVLYKAIAKYKNEKAIELLTVPFTQVKHKNIREYHIGFVYNAICENKDEIYDSLLWKLWSEENRITIDVFTYLKGKDSIKALELTKENMININKIHSENYNSYLFSREKPIIPVMLNFILKNDYKFGLEIIIENIKKTNAHLISNFTDKVIELNDKSFIEFLFERFEKESHPYIYLAVAEALLSYQDEAINKKILETRKINDNLNKDWGSESLDKLLEKYNKNKSN